MNVMNRLFNRNHGSGKVAKGRLEQVIAHDRARVSPGKLQTVRQEVIRAVARHLDIDPDGVRVELSRNGREIRVDAHIPLRRSPA